MFKYLRNAITSLVYPEGNIVEAQLKRLKSVEETTIFSKDLCILITSYEVTIDASDEEKIEHKYLPELVLKLKILKDTRSHQDNLETRVQEQVIKELIFIYKHRQTEMTEQRQKLLSSKVSQTINGNYDDCPTFERGGMYGMWGGSLKYT